MVRAGPAATAEAGPGQKLEFARSKSFATAKRDGTFKPMQKEAEKRKAAVALGRPP